LAKRRINHKLVSIGAFQPWILLTKNYNSTIPIIGSEKEAPNLDRNV